MIDFTIIGGGVIGTLIARELSKYNVSILLLEKENDIGNHATLANSAIVHSGHDPKPGSLKAQLCVRGNSLYESLSKELKIPLIFSGAFVMARDTDEVETLEMLYQRAIQNGVKQVALLDPEEARKQEPNMADGILKVLDLPTTKVTYPWEIAIAALQNAQENGAQYRLNAKVTKITPLEEGFEIEINEDERINTQYVINAAGVYADELGKFVEQEMPYKITPRRGEYYVLDKKVKGFVERVLYPVPSEKGKGVLVVPQVHGNILLGPTSEFQDEKENRDNHSDHLHWIKRDSEKLAKNIPFDLIIRTFSGLRATSTYSDFYIQPAKAYPQFIHVAGIDSPGLTAAPAIAEYVVNTLLNADETFTKKKDFNPFRTKKKPFHESTLEEKIALILDDRRYGNIVCKCERVTEAEVVEAIHSAVSSPTVKGIKKRVRAGSGLCQGGYCENTVVKLIARELKIPLTEVEYYEKNTAILWKETKVKR